MTGEETVGRADPRPLAPQFVLPVSGGKLRRGDMSLDDIEARIGLADPPLARLVRRMVSQLRDENARARVQLREARARITELEGSPNE